MPLVAIQTDNDKRTDLTELSFNDEIRLKSVNFHCPYCKEPLIFRRSHYRNNADVRSHFYHKPGSDCTNNESAEHLAAKRYLKRILLDTFKDVEGVTVALEYPINMDWREQGRIADICVVFGGGQKEVYECQLSPISLDDLKERTEDYIRANCDPYWYLGPKAATRENINYLWYKFGEVFELHVS